MDGFEKELQHLINRYSKENGSNTPDFILASYLDNVLKNTDELINWREQWYGRGNNSTEATEKSEPDAPVLDKCPCCNYPECDHDHHKYSDSYGSAHEDSGDGDNCKKDTEACCGPEWPSSKSFIVFHSAIVDNKELQEQVNVLEKASGLKVIPMYSTLPKAEIEIIHTVPSV